MDMIGCDDFDHRDLSNPEKSWLVCWWKCVEEIFEKSMVPFPMWAPPATGVVCTFHITRVWRKSISNTTYLSIGMIMIHYTDPDAPS